MHDYYIISHMHGQYFHVQFHKYIHTKNEKKGGCRGVSLNVL